MATLINKTEEVTRKLVKEGKLEILNTEEYMKIFNEIEKQMEEVRRDYIIKSHRSWMEAEKVIVSQSYN